MYSDVGLTDQETESYKSQEGRKGREGEKDPAVWELYLGKVSEQHSDILCTILTAFL